MSISDGLLAQFGFEIGATRTLLSRIPDAITSWKPHPKSATVGELVIHIASIPGWAVSTMTKPELDFAPPGGPAWTPPVFTSMAGTIALLDANEKSARAAMTGVPDSAMMEPWTLKVGGKVLFTQPRIAVMRGFVFSHLIHHRGQLTVYLRMNDIPLPPIYGPTADEGIPGA
ncbi:MAG TPA: DinB family protein [Planctomycetota bacterium]|jgi:uncharacterized damage-inducible protein DinB|nr:DinB family protein [Planctomycetota bacterium]